jgi:hypothetical protein
MVVHFSYFNCIQGVFLDQKLWQHFNDDFGPAKAEKELVDFALALINHVILLSKFTYFI